MKYFIYQFTLGGITTRSAQRVGVCAYPSITSLYFAVTKAGDILNSASEISKEEFIIAKEQFTDPA